MLLIEFAEQERFVTLITFISFEVLPDMLIVQFTVCK